MVVGQIQLASDELRHDGLHEAVQVGFEGRDLSVLVLEEEQLGLGQLQIGNQLLVGLLVAALLQNVGPVALSGGTDILGNRDTAVRGDGAAAALFVGTAVGGGDLLIQAVLGHFVGIAFGAVMDQQGASLRVEVVHPAHHGFDVAVALAQVGQSKGAGLDAGAGMGPHGLVGVLALQSGQHRVLGGLLVDFVGVRAFEGPDVGRDGTVAHARAVLSAQSGFVGLSVGQEVLGDQILVVQLLDVGQEVDHLLLLQHAVLHLAVVVDIDLVGGQAEGADDGAEEVGEVVGDGPRDFVGLAVAVGILVAEADEQIVQAFNVRRQISVGQAERLEPVVVDPHGAGVRDGRGVQLRQGVDVAVRSGDRAANQRILLQEGVQVGGQFLGDVVLQRNQNALRAQFDQLLVGQHAAHHDFRVALGVDGQVEGFLIAVEVDGVEIKVDAGGLFHQLEEHQLIPLAVDGVLDTHHGDGLGVGVDREVFVGEVVGGEVDLFRHCHSRGQKHGDNQQDCPQFLHGSFSFFLFIKAFCPDGKAALISSCDQPLMEPIMTPLTK